MKLTWPPVLLMSLLMSCIPRENQVRINSLKHAVDFVLQDNMTQISSIQYEIDECGRRDADVQLYYQLTLTLGYPDDFKFSEYHVALDTDSIIGYVNAFKEEADRYNWYDLDEAFVKRVLDTKNRLNKAQKHYQSESKQENYLLLLYNLFAYQNELIFDYSLKTSCLKR